KCFTTAAALIADPEIQLIAITTPPSAHEEVAIAALESGKYVLCEKPLAHTVSSARRIAMAEARHPGHLAVCYQLRYAPEIRRMLWLIQSGWIGELQSATIKR